MKTSSILTQEGVTPLLTTARENLARDGFVAPALFVALVTGERLVSLVALPKTPEAKPAYFTALGRQFRQAGRVITEALFLCESWFVNVQTAPAARTFLPSQHPSRQEAIVFVGRNADDTYTTCVIQPFHRNERNQLVWEPIPYAIYREPVANGQRAEGMLDYLFAGLRQG